MGYLFIRRYIGLHDIKQSFEWSLANLSFVLYIRDILTFSWPLIMYIAASTLMMFLCSVLIDILIPPSNSAPVYDCVSISVNAQHPTDRTWYFDTPYLQFQDWRRQRWNYWSFGHSYKTTRMGSIFLSRPLHLGKLPFILFYLYFTISLTRT